MFNKFFKSIGSDLAKQNNLVAGAFLRIRNDNSMFLFFFIS